MAVRATFDFNQHEHYRAMREVSRRTSARYVTWAFAAVAAVLLYWNVLRFWREYPLRDLVWSGLPWFLLGVFWLALFPIQQRRSAHKIATTDPSAQGPQVREIDEAGLHSVGNGVSLDLPWRVLLKAVETQEFFLFFYSKDVAYYLPKRALDARGADEVRALTRAHLGAKAHLAR